MNYNGPRNLDKERSMMKVEASKYGTDTKTLLADL